MPHALGDSTAKHTPGCVLMMMHAPTRYIARSSRRGTAVCMGLSCSDAFAHAKLQSGCAIYGPYVLVRTKTVKSLCTRLHGHLVVILGGLDKS